MQSRSPVLRSKGLHRFLGAEANRVHALRGVDLQVELGSTYAITGPSGCGKSSLLYLLGLLDRQDAGEIWIHEQLMDSASDIERTRARNQHIGFVFQFHFLLSEFTVRENIMLPMRKQGILSKKQMSERACDLLEQVALTHKRDQLVNHLSGGEQQRVAVARALANEPSIILADEPTGNLDVKNSELVFELLKQLAKQHNQAVVLVTHNPELAAEADYQLSMLDGQFEDRGAGLKRTRT